MFYKEINYDIAASYNHFKNVPVHKKREKFFKKIKDGKINNNNIIYYFNKYTKRTLYVRILGKIKSIIKPIYNDTRKI